MKTKELTMGELFVLRELVGNAIKYSSGLRIETKARGRVEISVKDTTNLPNLATSAMTL